MNNINFTEFINSIKKVKTPRNHKIKNSLGVLSCYRWCKANKINLGQSLTSKQFSDIIRTINKEIINSLLNSHSVILPCRMGTLELKKSTPKIYFKEDKLIVTNPIDWNKTLQLWYEDSEAKENKKTIKMEEKEIFRFYYNKLKANFKNKSCFFIKFNREAKLQLKQKVRQGNIDAYIKPKL